MGLSWRKSCRIGPCLAALAVLLTGCGGGAGGEAAQLARRACGGDASSGGPSLLDPSAAPPDSVASWDANRAVSNTRADLAAKAARLDGRWDVLASAFSADTGEWDRYRSAFVDQMNGGFVVTLDDAAKQAARTIGDQVTAECRKALSNP